LTIPPTQGIFKFRAWSSLLSDYHSDSDFGPVYNLHQESESGIIRLKIQIQIQIPKSVYIDPASVAIFVLASLSAFGEV
jgi:hypothetical protein